jgi:hypothetical protein
MPAGLSPNRVPPTRSVLRCKDAISDRVRRGRCAADLGHLDIPAVQTAPGRRPARSCARRPAEPGPDRLAMRPYRRCPAVPVWLEGWKGRRRGSVKAWSRSRRRLPLPPAAQGPAGRRGNCGGWSAWRRSRRPRRPCGGRDGPGNRRQQRCVPRSRLPGPWTPLPPVSGTQLTISNPKFPILPLRLNLPRPRWPPMPGPEHPRLLPGSGQGTGPRIPLRRTPLRGRTSGPGRPRSKIRQPGRHTAAAIRRLLRTSDYGMLGPANAAARLERESGSAQGRPTVRGRSFARPCALP